MSTNGPTDNDIQMNDVPAPFLMDGFPSNQPFQKIQEGISGIKQGVINFGQQSAHFMGQGANYLMQGASYLSQKADDNKLLIVGASTALLSVYGGAGYMMQTATDIANANLVFSNWAVPVAYVGTAGAIGATISSTCLGANHIGQKLTKGKKRKADEAELDTPVVKEVTPEQPAEDVVKVKTPVQPARVATPAKVATPPTVEIPAKVATPATV
ncbi:MAG: hypothetical protein JSS07_01880, partial [Proteobacteria bacterium]|nr:hypothetical protein [Pseudomonadota bacterium]